MSVWQALTTGEVATGPQQEDPELAGRTYAIPFGRVWDAVVRLSAGGLSGWKMIRWDDDAGLVEAEVHGPLFRLPADVTVRVVLDENAQTRVDLTARRRGRGRDLGTGSRRIRRFVRALDERLEAGSSEILSDGAATKSALA
ncbi:MAG: DUF1499 domain-containing protein [Longimicrobiales bacterium]